MNVRRYALLWSATAASLFCACQRDAAPSVASGAKANPPLAAIVPALNKEPVNSPDTDRLVLGQRSLGAAILGRLVSHEENVTFSPYSVHAALTMSALGARKETARQMREVLGLDALSREAITAGAAVQREAFSGASDPAALLTLRAANRLYVRDGFALAPAYVSALEGGFGAAPEIADFAHPEFARAAINGWVSAQTESMIVELIGPKMLTSRTLMTLVNAVYFKGQWEARFDEGRTSAASFIKLDGTEVEVEMMRQVASLRIGSHDQFDAVSLPYSGGEVDMLLVLPRRGAFDDVIKRAASDRFAAVLEVALTPQQVSLGVPKFDVRFQENLSPVLRALGIKDAFDAKKADFGGVSANAKKERLALDDVIHEAVVEVDEGGTEAAAATAVVGLEGLESVQQPRALTFDRPFLFMIRHLSTNAPLFVGTIVHPKAS